MTEQEKISLKMALKENAQTLIEQRIATARAAIAHAQESANQEEKSSAGDKYETSRAMSHLDKEMHTRQLAENIKELGLLHAIRVDVVYDTAGPGAFIQSAEGTFFIAAGLGKQVVQGREVIFLSPHAPLARVVQGKKAADSFIFKGKDTVISTVF